MYEFEGEKMKQIKIEYPYKKEGLKLVDADTGMAYAVCSTEEELIEKYLINIAIDEYGAGIRDNSKQEKIAMGLDLVKVPK